MSTEEKDGYFGLRHYCEEYSDFAISTLRQHCKSGGLPHYKVCGKILIKKSEFDEWMERFRVDPDLNLNAIVDGVMDSFN